MLGSALVLLSLTAAVLLVPSMVTLLVVQQHRHLDAGEDRTRRVRLVRAAVIVGLAALAVAALLGAGVGTASVIAVVLAASVLVWAPLGSGWAVRGVVVWSLATAGAGAFLGWLLSVMVTSSLSSAEWIVAGAAWLLLVVAVVPAQGVLRRLVTARAGRGAAPSAPPPLVRPALSLVALLAAGGVVVTLSSNTAGPGQGTTPPRAAGPAAPEAVGTPGVPSPVLSPALSAAPPARSVAPGGVTADAVGAMPPGWAGDRQVWLPAAAAPPQGEEGGYPAAGPVTAAVGPTSAPPGSPVTRPTVRTTPKPGGGPSSAPSPSAWAPTSVPGSVGGGATSGGGGGAAPSPSSPVSASPTVLRTRLHGAGGRTPRPQKPGAVSTPKGPGRGVGGPGASGPKGPPVPAAVQGPPSWAPPSWAPPSWAPPSWAPPSWAPPSWAPPVPPSPTPLLPVALPATDTGPPDHAVANGLPSEAPPKAHGGSPKADGGSSQK